LIGSGNGDVAGIPWLVQEWVISFILSSLQADKK